jgi:hypothetical protein
MELGFKREPDTWQDFLVKKSKISPFFEKQTFAELSGGAKPSPFRGARGFGVQVRSSPFTVRGWRFLVH